MRLSPRIERGAALLDLEAPGWENRVSTVSLDMSHGAYCVLGQQFGSYYSGLRVLDGAAAYHPAQFGFYKMGRESWENLTAKWKQLIEARREAA